MFCLINIFLSVVLSFTSCDKITINITMKSYKNIDIKFSGEDNKVVTNKEYYLFGLNDDGLKWGVRVELGRVPDEVFLKNPTPYGDLYTKFKWQEVKRNVRVKSARVLEVLKENKVLKAHVYINNATTLTKTKAKIYHKVESTLQSSWSEKGLPEDNIFYDLNINFNNGNMSYENKWRNSSLRNVYIPFGVSKNGEVVIEPGKEIAIQLTAFKIVAVIEIIYEARLIGQLVANYARVYGKYHFWAPTMSDIMRRIDLKNHIETREVIEIRCYTDPLMKVFNQLTGERVKIVYKPTPVHIKRILKHKVKI